MSLLDQLNEAGEFAPAWKPRDPGAQQHVIGRLSEIGQSTDSEGRPYRIYTIKQENGERIAVHAFHGVLKQELGKFKLKLGDDIGIKYLGQPEGKKYFRYAVIAPGSELNLDPVEIGDDVSGDLDNGGFQPVDFRPQPTNTPGQPANDDPPF